ncbi:MAG: hypothetical protein ACYTXI_39375 [Nostoc sp.]
MTNTNPQTEYDSPWKQILQLYFEEFMLFLLPHKRIREIDWTRQPEFLDKELEQVVRDAELGKRLAEKKSKNIPHWWRRILDTDTVRNPIPVRVRL